MTNNALCPECDHRLKLGVRPRIGQRSVCSKCNTPLEIVSLSPLELDIYDTYQPKPALTANRRTMAEAVCPECDCSIKLGTHPRGGQQIVCPECRTQLEVASLNPLELDILSVIRKGVNW